MWMTTLWPPKKSSGENEVISRLCIRLDRLKFELNNQDLRGGTLLSWRNIRYLDNILLDINARKGIDFETEDGIKYSLRKSDSKFLEPFQIVKVKNMKQFVPSKSF